MKISEIVKLLDAEVITGKENLGREVLSACGADMMSDVLAFVKEQALLLTGLVNPQVVRTAEMMDIICIAIVRGKTPDKAVIDLAAEKNIVLLATRRRMFEACGILYSNGIGAGKNAKEN